METGKIKEELEMDMVTYKKVKGQLPPEEEIKITGDKPETDTNSLYEGEEMGDSNKITYVSNIKDPDSKQVVKPFNINGKNYRIVRGMLPNKQEVTGVMCLDDVDENGDHMIYSVVDFDKKIATPAKEIKETEKQPVPASLLPQAPQSENYADCKHFLVNKKDGSIRKFGSIKELVSANKLEEEEYMGSNEFKQHMNEKLFGPKKEKKKQINELQAGDSEDMEMNLKAKKLMELLGKSQTIQTAIKTIVTPVAQRETIAAFAEMIGVPRAGLSSLIAGLKDIAKSSSSTSTTTTTAQLSESVVMTKNDFINSVK